MLFFGITERFRESLCLFSFMVVINARLVLLLPCIVVCLYDLRILSKTFFVSMAGGSSRSTSGDIGSLLVRSIFLVFYLTDNFISAYMSVGSQERQLLRPILFPPGRPRGRRRCAGRRDGRAALGGGASRLQAHLPLRHRAV